MNYDQILILTIYIKNVEMNSVQIISALNIKPI